MSRVQPAATGTMEVEKVFREIEGAFGMVPNLFRTYAAHPPLLEANWHKVKAVMMQGSLSGKVKQSIAVLVSMDNACRYCVAAHRGALRSMGVPEEEVKRIEEDIEKADFTRKEMAVIEFARKANREPLGIPDSDFTALKRSGASDAEIVEALGVMEVFTSFNKFLDALRVTVDF